MIEIIRMERRKPALYLLRNKIDNVTYNATKKESKAVIQMKKLNILIFAKLDRPQNGNLRDFILELKKHANVAIWRKDGEVYYILKTLKKRGFVPDFIFHYDFVYNSVYAPKIYGLGMAKIPKGVYYIDLQTQTDERRAFIHRNKINLIFGSSRDFFFRMFPEFKNKFRWLPFSNNPDIFKDWKLDKEIDFLLMGKVKAPKYLFRQKVLERMNGVRGFVYRQHPVEAGIRNININMKGVFLGEKYAKEINRSKMFFTCGTTFGYPVAKYFEVPACNTLLIAKGNRDLEDLGFVSGENFVECNENNFYDLAMYYLRNEGERKRIAQNGYNLVHSRHTNRVRAQEFVRTLSEDLKFLWNNCK